MYIYIYIKMYGIYIYIPFQHAILSPVLGFDLEINC